MQGLQLTVGPLLCLGRLVDPVLIALDLGEGALPRLDRERHAGKGVPLAQLPVNPGELRGGLFRLCVQRVVLVERLPHLGQPAEHRLERRGRDQVDLLPDQRPQPRFPEVAEVLRRELRQQRLLLLQRLRIRLVLRAGGLLPLPCERLAVRFLEVEFPFEVFPVFLQLLLRVGAVAALRLPGARGRDDARNRSGQPAALREVGAHG